MMTQQKASESKAIIARAKVTTLTTPFQHKTKERKEIPESQVVSASEKYDWTIGGRDVQMSGGFMEKHKHGQKDYDTPYIDGRYQDPTKPQIRKAGDYNIGIDYVVGGDKQVTPWYAGNVTMAKDNRDGYGNSVIVKTDYSYKNNGVSYPIYTRYSHLDSINVTQGSRVDPSTSVGVMGGSGNKGRNTYPVHVDFKSYIMVNGKEVQVSPNLMQRNLAKQESKGTLLSSSKISSTAIESNSSAKTSSMNNLETASAMKANSLDITSEVSEAATTGAIENVTDDRSDVSKVVTLLRNNAAEVKSHYGLDVTTADGLGKAVMEYWKENNLDPKTLKEQLPDVKESEFNAAFANANNKETTKTKDASQQR